MHCCFKRSLPAIYFHLLALLSPFNGEEKKVFLFSLIRYNNVCFDNKNRGNCISSVLREDPTFAGWGWKKNHTDSFFLLEGRGRTTTNFLCSASYILLCLDKILFVAPMFFLCFFLPCLYFTPCTGFQNCFKTCMTNKNCPFWSTQWPSENISSSTSRAPLTVNLLCLWYFVEGLL